MDNWLSEEFDCGCFLWEVDDRGEGESVSYSVVVSSVDGVVAGVIDCGDIGKRKIVGGGLVVFNFGAKIPKQ